MKLFKAEKIIDFIFGISHSDDSQSAYGLKLYLHLLNRHKFSSNTIHYLAYLYPRYTAIQNNNNDKQKKSKLKITVTPAKQMIESVSYKSFISAENKKLI
jgi:hypothetical protein